MFPSINTLRRFIQRMGDQFGIHYGAIPEIKKHVELLEKMYASKSGRRSFTFLSLSCDETDFGQPRMELNPSDYKNGKIRISGCVDYGECLSIRL